MIHLLRRSYGPTVSVAFALTLLWLGLAVLPANAGPNLKPLAETNVFTLEIDAEPPSAAPGERIVFTMTLANTDAATRTVAFSATLNGPVDGVRIELVRDESENVRTQRSARTAQGIRWLGNVGSEGVLTLRVTTRGDLLTSAGEEITLAAAAGAGLNNLPLQTSATVPISEVPPLGEGALALDVLFTDDAGNPIPIGPTGAEGDDSIALPSQASFRATITLSNTAETPVVALLTGAFVPTFLNEVAAAQDFARSVCAVEVTAVRVDSGVAVPVRPNVFGASAGPVDYAILATLGANSSARFQLQLELLGGYRCELQSNLELRARGLPTTFQPPLLPRPGILRNLFELTPRVWPPLLILAALSDLGDAPDSTNHFGVPMRAYAGVMANFPTVFNPATGLPQGPKHHFVRPLFLGDQVSQEIEADLTFLPLNRNIDPPNDIPDLDRFDDGINVGAATFQHCLPTTIPFRVTFSQAAVDRLKAEGKTAYLNIWLDGNRDGDWDDVLGCDGIPAPEHIVIDQVVMPAAGGVYDLMAPTGNLPIPQNLVGETMWLRATLSDEPSVKTAQVTSLGQVIEYGDGRGPANGFRLGETEDYLVKPAGYSGPGGPDLALDVKLRVWEDVVRGDGAAHSSIAHTIDEHAHVKIDTQIISRMRVRNLGDVATGGKLIIETTPYLGIPQVSVAQVETAIPAQLPFTEVCTTPDACHIELVVGELAPGALGEWLLKWSGEATDLAPSAVSDSLHAANVAVDFRVRVVADVTDADPTNNQFEGSTRGSITPLELLFPAPGVMQVTQNDLPGELGLASHWPQPLTATVTSGVVMGEPGGSFKFRVNGILGSTQMLDSAGAWSGSLPLVEGGNLLALEYATVPGYTEPEVLGYTLQNARIASFEVTRDLPWNPASFMANFGGAQMGGHAIAAGSAQIDLGMVNIVDPSGQASTDGWVLPVIAGQEMEVTLGVVDLSELLGIVDGCCIYPPVNLKIGDGTPIPLLSEGNSGLHRATFTPGAVADGTPVELTIGCDDETPNQTYSQCWVYSGVVKTWQPVQVVDGTSNTAVDGADFIMFETVMTENGRRAVPWHDGAGGQANPVVTDANGEALIVLPPGSYGITVRKPGYQPLRLGPVSADFFNGGKIVLTPVLDGAVDREIFFTEEGPSQAVVEIALGGRVRVVNAKLGNFEIQDFLDAATPASVQSSHPIQSGLIAPGEDYVMEFATLGDVRLVNTQNPGDEILIRVVEPQAASPSIFLPFMARTAGDGE